MHPFRDSFFTTTQTKEITGSVGLLLAAGCESHLHFSCCARERPPQGTTTSMMANRSDFCGSLGCGSWDCWSKLPPKTKTEIRNRERQFASVCTLVSLNCCCCLCVAYCAKTKILFLRLRSCARASYFSHPPPCGLILGDVDKNFEFFSLTELLLTRFANFWPLGTAMLA